MDFNHLDRIFKASDGLVDITGILDIDIDYPEDPDDFAPEPKPKQKNADHIPMHVKLGYGIGEISVNLQGVIKGFFFNQFLLDVAGLSPYEAGFVLMLSKIFDAITDPLIGALSDGTNTLWGRRRPWILFGLFPLGLSWLLLWQVPTFLDDSGLFVYYLIVTNIFGLALTVVYIPHAALTADLATTYNSRTTLTMYRVGCGLVGGLTLGFGHSIAVSIFKDHYYASASARDRTLNPGLFENRADVYAYNMTSSIYCFLMMLFPFITFLCCPEPPLQQQRLRQRETGESKRAVLMRRLREMKSALKIIFTNRAFITVLIVYTLDWISVTFVQNNLVLYVTHVIDAGPHFTYLMAAVMGTAAVFLFVWRWVCSYVGKKYTYILCASFWIMIQMLAYFVPEGNVAALYLMCFCGGAGISVAYLIPWSMLPDSIDYVEWQTGHRSEGIMYSLFMLFQKACLSIGLTLSNFILGWTGFISEQQINQHKNVQFKPNGLVKQPPSAILALRIMVGPAACVLLLLSIVVILFYPVTKSKLEYVQSELRKRKKQQQQQHQLETQQQQQQQEQLDDTETDHSRSQTLSSNAASSSALLRKSSRSPSYDSFSN